MRTTLLLRASLAIVFALAVGGCTSTNEDSAFREALSFAPAGAEQVTFTDWDAHKSELGFAGLTSQSSDGERERFLDALKDAAPFTGGALANYVFIMPEEYGWSLLDVDWELSALGSDVAPVDVVRLSDDLDLDVVTRSLTEHDFRTQRLGDRTLWVLDVSDADPTTGTPFFAASLIEDQHLLVTGSVEGIEAALAAVDGDSMADDAEVTAVADRLGPVSSAAILSGSQACPTIPQLLGARITPALLAQLHKDTPGLASVAPYETLGIGFPADEKVPARVVLRYADEQTAADDVAARRSLLDSGTSAITRRPYADYIDVVSAEAEGRDLIFELALPEGRSVLEQMLYQRDLLFASCPGG